MGFVAALKAKATQAFEIGRVHGLAIVAETLTAANEPELAEGLQLYVRALRKAAAKVMPLTDEERAHIDNGLQLLENVKPIFSELIQDMSMLVPDSLKEKAKAAEDAFYGVPAPEVSLDAPLQKQGLLPYLTELRGQLSSDFSVSVPRR